jgi:hypothetical protein
VVTSESVCTGWFPQREQPRRIPPASPLSGPRRILDVQDGDRCRALWMTEPFPRRSEGRPGNLRSPARRAVPCCAPGGARYAGSRTSRCRACCRTGGFRLVSTAARFSRVLSTDSGSRPYGSAIPAALRARTPDERRRSWAGWGMGLAEPSPWVWLRDDPIPVGAGNAVTSCDLHVLVQKAAARVSSQRPGGRAGGWGNAAPRAGGTVSDTNAATDVPQAARCDS